MIAPAELLRVLLAPALVAAVIAGIGRWRNWAWAMPLAAGTGFLTGYALLFLPKFPPLDGTDWLFWLAIPATLFGVLDAMVGGRWGWVLGALCGAVMLVIALPLVPQAVPAKALIVVVPVAVMGILGCVATWMCFPRVPSRAVVAGYCIILGGAAIIVMSSHVRIVGVYGLAAAASLGALAVFLGNQHSARSVAIVAYCLLVGVLTGGIYYADPGVDATNVAVMMGAPIALMAGFFVPGKRQWIRAAVSLIAVTTLVAIVTIPTAVKAKKAAEETAADPYGSYYEQ